MIPSAAPSTSNYVRDTFRCERVNQCKVRAGTQRRLVFNVPSMSDRHHRPQIRCGVGVSIRDQLL